MEYLNGTQVVNNLVAKKISFLSTRALKIEGKDLFIKFIPYDQDFVDLIDKYKKIRDLKNKNIICYHDIKITDNNTEWLEKETNYVVKLFTNSMKDDRGIMINMEKIDKCNFNDLLKQDPLNIFNSFVSQVCDALFFLHDSIGIIHNDLHFGNILCYKDKEDYTFKLIDLEDSELIDKDNIENDITALSIDNGTKQGQQFI